MSNYFQNFSIFIFKEHSEFYYHISIITTFLLFWFILYRRIPTLRYENDRLADTFMTDVFFSIYFAIISFFAIFYNFFDIIEQPLIFHSEVVRFIASSVIGYCLFFTFIVAFYSLSVPTTEYFYIRCFYIIEAIFYLLTDFVAAIFILVIGLSHITELLVHYEFFACNKGLMYHSDPKVRKSLLDICYIKFYFHIFNRALPSLILLIPMVIFILNNFTTYPYYAIQVLMSVLYYGLMMILSLFIYISKQEMVYLCSQRHQEKMKKLHKMKENTHSHID